MQRYVESVKNSLQAENWHAALVTAISIPDICMWLERGDKKPKETYEARYVEWHRRYLCERYTTTFRERDKSLLPGPAGSLATHEEMHARSEAIRRYMESGSTRRIELFTGEDFYGMRCAVLHTGASNIQPKSQRFLDNFILVKPRPGRSHHGSTIVGGGRNRLLLEIDIFCLEICDAADQWEANFGHNENVRSRKEQLITFREDLNHL